MREAKLMSIRAFRNTWYWVETVAPQEYRVRPLSPYKCTCGTFHYSFKADPTAGGFMCECIECHKQILFMYRENDSYSQYKPWTVYEAAPEKSEVDFMEMLDSTIGK